MTLDDAMDGQEVSQEEVERELLAHGADVGEFIDDLGEHESYDSSHVLAWLGY